MPPSPQRKKSRREQWFQFQKIWLANLRRELLGTDEHFGNPFCEHREEVCKPILPNVECTLDGFLPKRTLILDLDETLVHTEFDQSRGWITHRRPHVSTFLIEMSKDYEVVFRFASSFAFFLIDTSTQSKNNSTPSTLSPCIPHPVRGAQLVCFTSGLKPYASPIIDQLDPHKTISHRLYRDHTLSMKGIHVKDLARLNRDLARTIIIDNSPESYLMQPENAVPIKPFFADMNDTALLDLVPFLQDIARNNVIDVRTVLKKCHLKGRFAHDSSKKRGMEHKDRRISDIGAGSTPDCEFVDSCARMRSLSDVDHRIGDIGVGHLWEADDMHGGSFSNPIIIDVAPDHSPMLLECAHISAGAHAAAHQGGHKHMHRAYTDTSMGEYCMQQQANGDGACIGEGNSDREGQNADSFYHHQRLDGVAFHSAQHGGHAASWRGDDEGVQERESSSAAGGDALIDWSALHGSFAEVLRGMSPPPSMGLDPTSGELDGARSPHNGALASCKENGTKLLDGNWLHNKSTSSERQSL